MRQTHLVRITESRAISVSWKPTVKMIFLPLLMLELPVTGKFKPPLWRGTRRPQWQQSKLLMQVHNETNTEVENGKKGNSAMTSPGCRLRWHAWQPKLPDCHISERFGGAITEKQYLHNRGTRGKGWPTTTHQHAIPVLEPLTTISSPFRRPAVSPTVLETPLLSLHGGHPLKGTWFKESEVPVLANPALSWLGSNQDERQDRLHSAQEDLGWQTRYQVWLCLTWQGSLLSPAASSTPSWTPRRHCTMLCVTWGLPRHTFNHEYWLFHCHRSIRLS